MGYELLSKGNFRLVQDERWSLHPLMQRSVKQVLQQRGLAMAAHQKAIAYFLTNLKPSATTIADCTEELEIFHHRCELQQYDLAKQIMDRCVDFLDRSGYYRELVQVYKRLTHTWEEQCPTQPEAQRNLGWAWTRLGNTYQSLGQFRAAISAHQQAQQWFERIEDSWGKAACFGNLGNAYLSLGQYERAIEFHQQHFTIAHEIGDRQGEANSLGSLGNAYRSLGQYERAIEFLQQTLEISREIGDRQGEGQSLGNLGLAYDSLGQYEQAIEFHQQHLVISREIGDRQGEGQSLGNLGLAYRSLGQYEQAIEFHQQHLVISREIGDRQGEATSLGNLGLAYDSLGQYEQAIEFYQQSLAIAREIGDRRGKGQSLGNLGLAYRSLGQYEQAIEFHQQYLDISREIGDRRGQARSLFNKALALARYNPRRFEALETFKQARTIYAELGLDHEVESCDKAIHAFSQIVATEDLFAPKVAPAIGTPPPPDPQWEKSMPQPVTSRPASEGSSRTPKWVQIVWLFGGGIAIVVIAHILLNQ